MKRTTLICANGACVVLNNTSRIEMNNTSIGINSANELYISPKSDVGTSYAAPISTTSNTQVMSNVSTSSVNNNPPILPSVWAKYDYTITSDFPTSICKIDDGKIGIIENSNSDPTIKSCSYYDNNLSPDIPQTAIFQYLNVPKNSLNFSLNHDPLNTYNKIPDPNPSDSLYSYNIYTPSSDSNTFGYIENGECKYISYGMKNSTDNFNYVTINNK